MCLSMELNSKSNSQIPVELELHQGLLYKLYRAQSKFRELRFIHRKLYNQPH